MENKAETGTVQTCVKFEDSEVNPNYEKGKKIVGLLGGASPGDPQYYRQDVGGRPVYYEDGPPPPRHAGRLPMARPGNIYEDDSGAPDTYFTEFTNTKIRHAFVKKVYAILFIQLGYTATNVALFVLEPNCNEFAQRHRYVPLIFIMAALIFYIILVCSASCRRNYPGNIILLGVYTILSSIGYGGIAALYAPDIVLYAFAITAAVCLVVTLLAMQTWVDITGWGIYLCLISVVLMIFGIVCMIMMLVMGWNDTTRIMYLVYASIAALVTSLYFMYITQLILGGRKHELSPEDYVLGAIILYTDIMQLFILIMSIFGAARS